MIQKIRSDKKGVSPVIGVILMVAATIVIAAVVIAMLGGFTAPTTPPTMLFGVVDADGAGPDTLIKITQTGGDSASAGDLRYQVLDSDDIEVASGVMPNPGASDTIWDPGDSNADTLTAGSEGIFTVRVSHVPTGQIVYSGTVRVRIP